jgi:hypothetical protein
MKKRMLLVGMLGLLAICMITVGCSHKGGVPKPESFIVTHDATGDWRIIEIRNDLIGKKDTIWSVLVDTVSTKYDLETLSKETGYLRSSWKHTYIYNEQIISNYRSRIVVKIDDVKPELKIKVESNWLSDRGWLQGYDTILLKDIYSDIQGKVGRIISR